MDYSATKISMDFLKEHLTEWFHRSFWKKWTSKTAKSKKLKVVEGNIIYLTKY